MGLDKSQQHNNIKNRQGCTCIDSLAALISHSPFP